MDAAVIRRVASQREGEGQGGRGEAQAENEKPKKTQDERKPGERSDHFMGFVPLSQALYTPVVERSSRQRARTCPRVLIKPRFVDTQSIS